MQGVEDDADSGTDSDADEDAGIGQAGEEGTQGHGSTARENAIGRRVELKGKDSKVGWAAEL